jgi:hypothetical protein
LLQRGKDTRFIQGLQGRSQQSREDEDKAQTRAERGFAEYDVQFFAAC